MSYLIDNWLLAENQPYYNRKTNRLEAYNLPIIVNMYFSSATERYVVPEQYKDKFRPDDLVALTEASRYTLEFLLEGPLNYKNLATDDGLYIYWNKYFLQVIKARSLESNFDMPITIKITSQYAQWRIEAGLPVTYQS